MTHHFHRTALTIVFGALVPLGCAPSGPSALRPVPEDQIPALEARFAAEPTRALEAQLAASLLEADRCEEASAVARNAVSSPFDSWPTLVEGECLERRGRFEEALTVYRRYLARYGDGEGGPPVRGKVLLAERRLALAQAGALSRGPSPEPGAPNRIAVLPFRVRGDDDLEALGWTLAMRLSNDLAELPELEVVDPLVVRLALDRVGPVDDLGVDSAQARLVGSILGAGQVIRGTAFLAESALNRLGTDVFLTDGPSVRAGRVEGALADLPRLEKELSLTTAEVLGESPSPEERNRILYRGPRDLPSLTAYAEALDREGRQAYAEAAASYAEVARLDPEFGAAREGLEANAAAGVLMTSPNLLSLDVAVAAAVESALRPGRRVDPARLAIRAGTSDVSATQGERITGVVAASAEDGALGSIQNLEAPALLTPAQLTGLVRILVVVPGG